MTTVSRRRFLSTTAAFGVLTALDPGAGGRRAAAAGTDLRVGMSVDPVTPGDPRQTMSGLAGLSQAVPHVFETLVVRDDAMRPGPGLAERWDQIDPTTLRLHLRKGVKFHNGEPFDGESVKYTIESILAPASKSHRKSQIQAVKEISIPSAHVVDLNTGVPNRPLLRMLGNIPIMAPKASQAQGERIATTPVGTGPFRHAEYLPGNRWVLKASPDYWGPRPRLQQVTWRYVKDDGARVAALLAGDVDVINNVPPDQIGRVKSAGKAVESVVGTFIIYCGMRCDRGPFTDIRVRQALNYAVDKKAIVDKLLAGQGQVADSPLAPTLAYRRSLGAWPYDPERARALLKEAGYDGRTAREVVFGTAVGRYIRDREIGQAISGYLEAVGFKHRFEAPDWPAYFSAVRRGGDSSKYDMFILGYGPQSMEPDQLLSYAFQSKPYLNTMAYANPEVDRLLQAGRETFDESKLAGIYGDLTKTVWNDAPVIWLHFQPEITAFASGLKGYGPRADSMLSVVTAAW
jgi:ABC-type transport system substrate-binding protein